jgi:ABC-type lipoprotein export system ATPase subunit
MKLLECKGLFLEKAGRGGRRKVVLDDIDAKFHAGRMAAILGDVGAGKSTLLHVLAVLVRPTRGEVSADGESVSRWVSRHRDLWRRKTGLVFQKAFAIAGLTVLENVCVPLVPRSMPVARVRKTALDALSRTGLDHLAGQSVSTLSGGELQRLSFARAIVSDPELILADEPTSHQDPENVERITGLLNEFARKGSIVVTASHDPRLLNSELFDDRFLIENGKLRKLSP